jgi:glycosyltransferase involved in cell wall biosynthesis
MKVAFIPTNVSGVMFYRCWQPAEALRRLGIKVAVLWYQKNMFLLHPWEEDVYKEYAGAANFNIMRDVDMACEDSDVIVWMGLHTPRSLQLFLESKARYPRKKFVTEIDDYIFSIPHAELSDAYAPGAILSDVFAEQIKRSDAIIVSTPALADFYGEFNKNVHVVENMIDLSLWRKVNTQHPRQRVNIGWVGGATHDEDLRMIKDVILGMVEDRLDVEFTFLHGVPSFLKHKPGCRLMGERLERPPCYLCKGLDRVRWTHDFKSMDHYPKWVHSYKFDIGIAPLLENNFNQAKSNLRWLEYSAMGIPTVASPLSHFRKSIRHGETGFIACDDKEWRGCLDALVDDIEVRRYLGEKARKEIEGNWNTSLLGERYKETLEKIIHESNPCDTGDSDRGIDQRSQPHAVQPV